MKKVLAVVLILVGLTFVIVMTGVGIYNDMIGKRNATTKAWSDVEAAYQRRLDVIKKFAEVAKFSVKFQVELATKHADARKELAKAAETKSPDKLQEVANTTTAGLTIFVRQEAVPEAKTDQLTELNAQIESVERTINHERKMFNQAVLDYNNTIQTIPGVWFAKKWNFLSKESFKAQEGADKSPDLELE